MVARNCRLVTSTLSFVVPAVVQGESEPGSECFVDIAFLNAALNNGIGERSLCEPSNDGQEVRSIGAPTPAHVPRIEKASHPASDDVLLVFGSVDPNGSIPTMRLVRAGCTARMSRFFGKRESSALGRI